MAVTSGGDRAAAVRQADGGLARSTAISASQRPVEDLEVRKPGVPGAPRRRATGRVLQLRRRTVPCTTPARPGRDENGLHGTNAR